MHSSERPVVAVIDDDHRVLESLEELLESAGYHARLFSSALEFLESGTAAMTQCVISDIRMPGMDGWELESAVSRAQPDLPVILIAGDDVANREMQLRQSRERHRVLFGKPFDSHELLAATRAAIGDQVS